MGVDICAYGIRHELEVRKPARLVRQISQIHRVDVKVRYCDDSPEANIYDIYTYVYEGDRSSDIQTAILYLPPNEYLNEYLQQQRKRMWKWKCKKILNTLDLSNPDLEAAIAKSLTAEDRGHYDFSCSVKHVFIEIYDDIIDLGPSSACRWWLFDDWFKIRVADETSTEELDSLRDSVEKERRYAIAKASAYGCDYIIYAPDQWAGEWISDAKDRMNADEFVDFIKSKRVFRQFWEDCVSKQLGYAQYGLKEFMENHLVLKIQDRPVFPDTERIIEISAIFDYFREYPDLE